MNNKSPQLGRQQTLLKIKGKCSTGSSAVDFFIYKIMKKEKKGGENGKKKKEQKLGAEKERVGLRIRQRLLPNIGPKHL